MGCTQGRPTQSSPPGSLEKLKMENGYVIGGRVAARRSTGQRHYTSNVGQYVRQDIRLVGGGNPSAARPSVGSRAGQEKRITGEGMKVTSDGGDEGGKHVKSGRSSTGRGGSLEKKPVIKERESLSANGGDGNVTRATSTTKSDGDDGEPVDGWPKWLTDNIPGDALEGLTPRSADTYDKIDKVNLSSYC